MKRLIVLLLLLCALRPAQAQPLSDEPLPFAFRLHGQTRRYLFAFRTAGDSVRLDWRILRNGAWQSGSYTMLPESVEQGTRLSFLQPEDGRHVVLSPGETFAMLSRAALRALKTTGSFRCDGIEYRLCDTLRRAGGRPLLHVADAAEGCEMWIADDEALPLIREMRGNPLEIDWIVTDDRTANVPALRDELRRAPEKTAGIYRAYPEPAPEAIAPPAGYAPVYVSHYGRHGSRWITSDERYRQVIDRFEAARDRLTPLGEEVLKRLQIVWADAEGRGGDLTPLGERQHRAIAARLCRRCPELFGRDRLRIDAASSLASRCILSMTAFTEALTAFNPTLRIAREASRRTMRTIAWTSPEAAAFGAEDAPWRAAFHAYEERNIRPERLIASLFRDPAAVDSPRELMMGLYWIASDMQDVELPVSFYDLFTPDELYAIWSSINYRMYLCNADAPHNGGTAIRSAAPLLRQLLDDADRALREGAPGATLRFGHDTNLIRLLALMQVEGCAARESDPERYAEAWQDFRISPMAANLQLIFFRNAAGRVLVQLLHNERTVRLPLTSAEAPFYEWPALRRFWEDRLSGL